MADCHQPKERQFVRAYTRQYPNLGVLSTQRNKNYHVVVKAVVHQQLPLPDAVRQLRDQIKMLAENINEEINKQRRVLPRMMDKTAFQIRHSASLSRIGRQRSCRMLMLNSRLNLDVCQHVNYPYDVAYRVDIEYILQSLRRCRCLFPLYILVGYWTSPRAFWDPGLCCLLPSMMRRRRTGQQGRSISRLRSQYGNVSGSQRE